MKTILFMATSANGFVARLNGDEDFLPHDGWIQMLEYIKEYGHLVWGRKTYEAVKSWGGDFMKDLEGVPMIIVSKNKRDYPKKNVVVCQTLNEVVKIAQERGYKKLFLSGGPSINTSFAEAGLIKEIIINYNPTILGDGIKLFKESNFELNLELKKVEKLPNGIIQAHYLVV